MIGFRKMLRSGSFLPVRFGAFHRQLLSGADVRGG